MFLIQHPQFVCYQIPQEPLSLGLWRAFSEYDHKQATPLFSVSRSVLVLLFQKVAPVRQL